MSGMPHGVCRKLLTGLLAATAINLPLAAAQSWKHYPLTLENNPDLTFPAIEGLQTQHMSDSWFLTAHVVGQTSGKEYQLVTIFDTNRFAPGASLSIYQASIFDYASGAFNTFTEYELPGLSAIQRKFAAATGSLDLTFASAAGNATWHNKKQADGALTPFVYDLHCPGKDITSSAPFSFDITADMQKPPVAFGASTLRGFFNCYAQPNTLSYFNPGPAITGSLTFNGTTEPIRGTQGHLDRQSFPLYTGIVTPTGRQHSYIWSQANLDDGSDISAWLQFDRVAGNARIPDSGITLSHPPNRPSYTPFSLTDANNTQLKILSYAKFPRAQYATLIPPPSKNMYLPTHIVLTNTAANLSLEGRYTSPAPAAMLPIEYFEGPVRWHGVRDGQPVSGTGVLESTLALYRDFELAAVLRDTVAALAPAAFGTTGRDEVLRAVDGLAGRVAPGVLGDRRGEAARFNAQRVRPALETLVDGGARAWVLEIDDDFVSSLALVLEF